MEIARRAKATKKAEVFDIGATRSNFDRVDALFFDPRLTRRLQSLRRIFSLSRASGCETLMVESIPAHGSIQEENEDILQRFSDYCMEALVRLSFWRRRFEDTSNLPEEKELMGVVLCKLDSVPSHVLSLDKQPYFQWQIYEAIFRKSLHRHNYVPIAKHFSVLIGDREYQLPGVLYCQQNGLNKACAQVALRSVCLNVLKSEDLSYRQIHQLARGSGEDFDPSAGLQANQIQRVLEGLEIPFEHLDYTRDGNGATDEALKAIASVFRSHGKRLSGEDQDFIRSQLVNWILEKLNQEGADLAAREFKISSGFVCNSLGIKDKALAGDICKSLSNVSMSAGDMLMFQPFLTSLRSEIPYQRLLYSGIESGGGALLGFDLAVPAGEEGGRHMVPVFGHTFNADTWVPNATSTYFRIGQTTQYVSSDNWLSSFIMHDDNFGANFCVPKLFVLPTQVSYVVALLRKGAAYGGLTAEAIAIDFMYALAPTLLAKKAKWHTSWHERLERSVARQEVVIRAICVSRSEFIDDLKRSRDWEDNKEDPALIQFFEPLLPDLLWLVEFSIPELFPVNQRKIGEFLFDASRKPDETQKLDYSVFVLARFPQIYVLKNKKSTKPMTTSFAAYRSHLSGHTPLFRFPE